MKKCNAKSGHPLCPTRYGSTNYASVILLTLANYELQTFYCLPLDDFSARIHFFSYVLRKVHQINFSEKTHYIANSDYLYRPKQLWMACQKKFMKQVLMKHNLLL